jgi:hypothetical protein
MVLTRVLHLFLMLFAVPIGARGQEEHPFIDAFDLTVLDGRIQVAWTMKGGSTCDGTEVERGTDGVSFSVVHRIAGICGDPSVPVSFSWIDAAPPEFSTVHYRIRMGVDGTSSMKQVVFDQLVTTDQRIFPVPVVENATLALNVPLSASVQIQVHDAQGKLVHEHSGNGRNHTLLLSAIATGAYTYTATSGSRSFQGRFVKE